jgi:hypothetical protein
MELKLLLEISVEFAYSERGPNVSSCKALAFLPPITLN